jgi:outer membrane protein
VRRLIFFFVIVLFSASVFAQSAQKIGYVNSQTILEQYPAAIKAKSDLDAIVAKWRQEADSMQTALQQFYADYQKQANTMTPEKQRESQQKLVMKDQEIQQFQQQKFGQPNGEYYQKENQIMGPVKQKIFEAIEKVAKEEGLNFVFDKTGDVVLLYADADTDITFKVLDKLKRGK